MNGDVHVWREQDSEILLRFLSFLCFVSIVFFPLPPLSLPLHLVLSEVRQNNICEDALEWNILVTYLVRLGHYSKTHTSSFTQSRTHTHTHLAHTRTVGCCSHTLRSGTAETRNLECQWHVAALPPWPLLHVGQPHWATLFHPSAAPFPSALFFLFFCSFLTLMLRTNGPVLSRRQHKSQHRGLLLLSLTI